MISLSAVRADITTRRVDAIVNAPTARCWAAVASMVPSTGLRAPTSSPPVGG